MTYKVKPSGNIRQKLTHTILVFIFLFMACSHSFGQGRLGILLEEGSVICTSTISGELYRGIDNYVKIDTSISHSYDELALKVSNGSVEKDSADLFLVIPTKAGRMRLTILHVPDDSAAIGYVYMNVRTVPDPKLMLNNYRISSAADLPKALLMDCDSLSIYFTDDLPGSHAWIKIQEFTLGYNYGGFHVSHLNPSNKMLFETKEIINRLGPEHVISIRVKVEYEGQITRELPIYRITIY